jgi:uncharacterized protein (TIGR00299 family) protein
MLLAALLDAGANEGVLQSLPGRLRLEGVEIVVERVERQGIGALHLRVVDSAETARSPREMEALVASADLPKPVRDRALEVIYRLTATEARIHGVPVEDVHFHELSGVDTVIDVCGVLALLDDLQVQRVACSPIPFARGMTDSAHGALPLPAPATLALLQGAPLVGVEGGAELVTPTGAALVAVLADDWGLLPPIRLEATGYGAGSADLEDRPNLVRVIIGSEASPRVRDVVIVETNLDDLSPELVPDAVETCFLAGALDVWTVPAQMKKGRPGVVLSALTRPEAEADVVRAMLQETSALGVRVARLGRYELERDHRVVQVVGGTVRIKLGILDGRVINVAPEHDDCAAVARSTGRTVKSVWAEALAEAHKQ